MSDLIKIIFVIIFAMVAITVTTWILMPAGKIVERITLEQSLQYSEARKSEIATFQSTLDEIDAKLAIPSLDPVSKSNLEAQRMTVSAQLNAAKRR